MKFTGLTAFKIRKTELISGVMLILDVDHGVRINISETYIVRNSASYIIGVRHG